MEVVVDEGDVVSFSLVLFTPGQLDQSFEVTLTFNLMDGDKASMYNVPRLLHAYVMNVLMNEILASLRVCMTLYNYNCINMCTSIV